MALCSVLHASLSLTLCKVYEYLLDTFKGDIHYEVDSKEQKYFSPPPSKVHLLSITPGKVAVVLTLASAALVGHVIAKWDLKKIRALPRRRTVRLTSQVDYSLPNE